MRMIKTISAALTCAALASALGDPAHAGAPKSPASIVAIETNSFVDLLSDACKKSGGSMGPNAKFPDVIQCNAPDGTINAFAYQIVDLNTPADPSQPSTATIRFIVGAYQGHIAIEARQRPQ